MTGFGRFEASGASRRFCVEIKSVNHRYLDLSIKMPRLLNPFESKIRAAVRKYAERGKIDLFVTMGLEEAAAGQVVYNRAMAAQYCQSLKRIAEDFGLENDIRVSHLSRFPEVLTVEEAPADEDALWEELSGVLTGALERFAESRSREGDHLKQDLLEKCDELSAHVDFIRECSPEILARYKEELREKVVALLGDAQVEESRLLMETTLYADKICVDEEIVRLSSHFAAMKKTLEEGGAVGRKLDFLAQEMNREANTILSKAGDLKISDAGIELKTGIEKLREQIQNIE